MSKSLKWVLLGAAVVGAAFVGYRYWQTKRSKLPEGIFYGNGRLEAKLVDVAAKEPLRVKQILVDEGDLVAPGEVLVRMDTVTLDAELAAAQANVIATQEREAIVQAAILRRQAELNLAKIEVERAKNLLRENAGSQRELDVRTASLETSSAALEEEQARLRTSKYEVAVALANVDTIQTRIDDATLRSPVRGRVLYRLAEVGEVLGAGGKALTLVNLGDVYMEIFLPAEQAARVAIGDEARITIDFIPGAAAPGYVSFVSPEAQFTPKQVETRSEREKLMFRVKIQVPEELIVPYIQNVKTGIRGVGYVKTGKAAWPAWLQNPLKAVTQPATAEASEPAESGPASSNIQTTTTPHER